MDRKMVARWLAKVRDLLSSEALIPFDLPEPDYSDQVRSFLVSILMDERGVSEKSFAQLDELQAEVDELWGSESEIGVILTRFKAQGSRPRFCAEYIYSICED